MRKTALAASLLTALSATAHAQMGPFDYGQTTDAAMNGGAPAPKEPPKAPPLETNPGPAAQTLVGAGNAGFSGSGAQVKADAGKPFDGNGAKPDTVAAGAPERIDITGSGGFNRGQWSGDGSQKPAGFEDVPDQKKKDDSPGFLEKAGKFIKDLGMGGWLLKAGLVLAFFGIFTFNPALMWAGFGIMIGGGVWSIIFGS